ncbi:hypothetical protein ACSSS7_002398 [Eimeria intestinalis]
MLCAFLNQRRGSVKAVKSDDEADSDFSSSSSSRESSPEERSCVRRRRGPSRVSRGRRDVSPIVDIWEEEEEDDEAALKREAQGFVKFEDGRVFYSTYTATELIDSETKLKGRQTKVQEAPSAFTPPEADGSPSFTSSGGGPPQGKKRKRQPAGSRGAGHGVRRPLRFEVRWVFDARDLAQLGGYPSGGGPLGMDEFAESDRSLLSYKSFHKSGGFFKGGYSVGAPQGGHSMRVPQEGSLMGGLSRRAPRRGRLNHSL